MRYVSTRGQDVAENAADAICNGIAKDGGLYVPETIPRLTRDELALLREADYRQAAAVVLGKYLSGYTEAEIADAVHAAYTGAFDGDAPAPLHVLSPSCSVMELWHGPTLAFKDIALQMLPQLVTRALSKRADVDRFCVLVATSGDTGKAALEGFRDVPGTSVTVLFPRDGVSQMQRLQMQTQRGGNVSVIAMDGNFDDAQTAVKQVFADRSLQSELLDRGVLLSSANSINWGRLLPQIVYYAHTAATRPGVTDFIVPTGNFGNILACWYAKRMGAPIGTLVCASNANAVLTEFFTTGAYDSRRTLHRTLSPSMDILISSNLERLLFELSGRDAVEVRRMMEELGARGGYRVRKDMHEALSAEFLAYSCDDAATMAQIRHTYQEHRYVIDPHTAAAMHAWHEYSKARPHASAVVASTASPFKFPQAVIRAITGVDRTDADPDTALHELSALASTPVPRALAELSSLPLLHHDTCGKDSVQALLRERLLSLC